MKELYIAPEAEIICFAPVEELALDGASWQNLGGGADGSEIYNPEPTDPSMDGEITP